jgi:apolipoprotein N-acyltransferase
MFLLIYFATGRLNGSHYSKCIPFVLMVLSFFLVALAQPDWSPFCCVLASSFGYALFWKGLGSIQGRKTQFFLAFFWFAAISACHLNWFFADRYVGIYIYPFLMLLFAGLGAQFGFITLMVRKKGAMGIGRMLALSGLWTILEWGRLWVLSGYSWNPVGLALSGTLVGMQIASAIGVYGMTFLVFLTNLLALRFFFSLLHGHLSIWLIFALVPYLFGWAHLSMHTRYPHQNIAPSLSTLLVQTSIRPEEKIAICGSRPLSPLQQWERILSLLAPHLGKGHDLIIFSEGVVPYGTDTPIYPFESVEYTFYKIFGEHVPYQPGKRVGNRAWAQALAQMTSSYVIIGLETYLDDCAYNAAFFFDPKCASAEHYDKRILVPMGEYIPFQWCKKILSKYGIQDSFMPGKEAKIFAIGKALAGICICYEETFGHLMRANRQKGAQFLISLSNDIWYPFSRLPRVHFLHGRLRALEEGIPLLRACNTGVTCGIDAVGRTIGELPYERKAFSSPAGVLPLTVPLYHYATFYTLFGDGLAIYGSLLSFCLYYFFLLVNKKAFNLKYLNIYSLRKNKG